ncbi:MAG: hypothetical protein IJH08_05240, partial [Atopobiaceae bacterium]|nr:hypothetical protein [Atopobiaceae bacterium]
MVEVEGRLPDEDPVEPEDPEPLPEKCELEDPLPEDELLPELDPDGLLVEPVELLPLLDELELVGVELVSDFPSSEAAVFFV